ncbi:MAG TPA: hypothetical protein VMJ10_31820 [Kofleriaceae bacterium]|nr:hypothetical protein [Kofleriaceae bacterium]
MTHAITLVLVAACGRLGFDREGASSSTESGGAPNTIDAGAGTVDAPDDGMPTLVASSTNSMDGVSSLVITVPALATGDLVIAGVNMHERSGAVSAATDDAPIANTYVSARVPCRVGDTSTGQSNEIWYAVVTSPGATRIEFEFNDKVGGSIWILELAGMAITSPLDAAATTVLPPDAIANAPSVSISNAHELVFSIINLTTGNVSGIHAGNPFTALPRLEGDGAAFAFTSRIGSYGAAWDETSTSIACASTAAFRAL